MASNNTTSASAGPLSNASRWWSVAWVTWSTNHEREQRGRLHLHGQGTQLGVVLRLFGGFPIRRIRCPDEAAARTDQQGAPVLERPSVSGRVYDVMLATKRTDGFAVLSNGMQAAPPLNTIHRRDSGGVACCIRRNGPRIGEEGAVRAYL